MVGCSSTRACWCRGIDAVVREAHRPGDEVVVEWRALTVALLDRLAPLVRAAAGPGRT